MRMLPVPAQLKQAIAAAILDDEANLNGEHLFDGEQILFYCPMQGHGLPCDGRPRVPVRDLLPPSARVPSFTEYLAMSRPGTPLSELSSVERAALQREWERDARTRLAAALPDRVTLND
ncbi:MAG TPA: hypothetical protein VFA70_07065 [Dehalococcoidia bacterium]|nr:hypothetical protein [Dehalococcoidia bacterium]